jgi:hypothetical protein
MERKNLEKLKADLGSVSWIEATREKRRHYGWENLVRQEPNKAYNAFLVSPIADLGRAFMNEYDG